MEIDEKWVDEYIKKHGNRIIIPKEATIIKRNAFDINHTDENKKFEVYFENESKLEKIESFAFYYFPICNKLIIPRNIKQIDAWALLGLPMDVRIESGSDIEICESDWIFMGKKNIEVPPRLKKLRLTDILEHVDSIKIPSDSVLEDLQVTCKADRIILPSGLKLELSEEKRPFALRLHNKKATFLYKGKFYEIINANSGKKLLEGNYYNSTTDLLDRPILEFNSIFDIDYDAVKDDDFLIFKTDYNTINEFFMQYGTREGPIYTLEEVKKIKDILMDIISKVNIPPEHIQDREKIIYAQIVQNLSSYLEYDFESLDLIDANEEIYYLEDEELTQINDKIQNMKGILNKKTCCKGMSTIINTLAIYFGMNSRTIYNADHAWNVVTLDGTDYEDDFTWYIYNLKDGTISQITTFLNGSINNRRTFEDLPYHSISEKLSLGKGITDSQKLNLLGTDWSKIQDWEKVNINKSNILSNFMQQLRDLYNKTIISKNNINLGGHDEISK